MSENKINEPFSRLAELMDRQNRISQELIELKDIKALKNGPQDFKQAIQRPVPDN